MLARFLEAALQPPPAHVAERSRLLARAERLAGSAHATVHDRAVKRPDEIDVVVAGSGFLSLYFLGVHSVLSRLTRCARFAGASSGGQAPLELLLAGEAATLDAYLAHGAVCGQATAVRAVWAADRHWRAWGDALVEAHADRLPEIDGVCYVSVTHLGWRGVTNTVYSRFGGNPTLAKEVFYATGTLLTRCNGRWSTDGGVSNNGPAFTDAPTRPQLLVDPTKSGLPLRMAFQFTVEQFTAAVQLGQDDTVRLWEAQEGDQMPAALSWIGAAAAEK